MKDKFDKVIIGAGIYGLYAALFCAKKGEDIIILEYDSDAFGRASYINQARVHNGYHYPRSYSTAIKSSKYFERFNNQFEFAINKSFRKIYATSSSFSWTSSKQFKKFCTAANIKCNHIEETEFFKQGMCSGVFETDEYTFDAMIIKNHLLEELKKYKNVIIKYSTRIHEITLNKPQNYYFIHFKNEDLTLKTAYVLNATYGSVNQILSYANFDPFKIKYEICEVILCEVSNNIKNTGITVMDGPFFSLMPFGKTGLHSLTSVLFTPHLTSYEQLPKFDCQLGVECSPNQLNNCNLCSNKPKSAWPYMEALAKKMLQKDIKIKYIKSLFSIKPILLTSEIDDSRPTVMKFFSENPTFVSVLSGKINTIYDLEEIL